MIFGVIFSSTTGHVISYWERELGKQITQDQLEPVTWLVYQNAATRTGADYCIAIEECQKFSRKMAQWFHKGEYDILLNTTLTVPPIKLGNFAPKNLRKVGKVIQLMSQLAAYALIYNITGQPAMSVPLYWTADNIPIGIQFAAPFGDEATLFRLAAQLEQERPWANKKPPIHCSN